MKHKWKDNVCTVCGCKRDYVQGFVFYTRNGISYQLGRYVECIDWDEENKKTID